MWNTKQEAVTNLRRLLSDGPTDKLAFRKKVFGDRNGTNTAFKTFERRRIQDFSSSATEKPFGVYKAGVLLTDADFTADFPESGDFVLAVAPEEADELEASYYSQWFNDDELMTFLENSAQWLGLGTDYTKIPDGLIPAALHYAGQEAYDRLALWHSVRMAETYMVNDLPADSAKIVMQSFSDMSKKFREKSNELRKGYYTKQDQNESAIFGVAGGRVGDYLPRR